MGLREFRSSGQIHQVLGRGPDGVRLVHHLPEYLPCCRRRLQQSPCSVEEAFRGNLFLGNELGKAQLARSFCVAVLFSVIRDRYEYHRLPEGHRFRYHTVARSADDHVGCLQQSVLVINPTVDGNATVPRWS